jgi:hypothetical protein
MLADQEKGGRDTQDSQLHFIDSGKPSQNAYVESFSCRLADECVRGRGAALFASI